MSTGYLYYNRSLCDASTVPDWVFGAPELSPPGYYTTFPWYRGEVWQMDAHLDRLSSSLQKAERDARFEPTFIGRLLDELSRANGIAEGAKVRVSVLVEPWGAIRDVVVLMQPVCSEELRERRLHGVRLETAVQRRFVGDRGFASKRLGLTFPGRDLNPYSLFLNSNGEISEATYGNMFFVRLDGSLVTPPVEAPCLPGITRHWVVRTAGELGVSLSVEPVAIDGHRDWAEVFMTSSIGGIIPVHHIDDIPFSLHLPDGITAKFQRRLAGTFTFYGVNL